MEFAVKVLAFAALLVNAVTGNPFIQDKIVSNSVENQTVDAEILRSLITVYALPPNGGSIRVKLYSGNDETVRTFTELGSLELSFNRGPSTKFWVDATKTDGSGGLRNINHKPVFGDGVPSKSGTWWVDDTGMKRIKEDSKDCPGSCSSYSQGWS